MTSGISSIPTSSHFMQHLETGPQYAHAVYILSDFTHCYWCLY